MKKSVAPTKSVEKGPGWGHCSWVCYDTTAQSLVSPEHMSTCGSVGGVLPRTWPQTSRRWPGTPVSRTSSPGTCTMSSEVPRLTSYLSTSWWPSLASPFLPQYSAQLFNQQDLLFLHHLATQCVVHIPHTFSPSLFFSTGIFFFTLATQCVVHFPPPLYQSLSFKFSFLWFLSTTKSACFVLFPILVLHTKSDNEYSPIHTHYTQHSIYASLNTQYTHHNQDTHHTQHSIYSSHSIYSLHSTLNILIIFNIPFHTIPNYSKPFQTSPYHSIPFQLTLTSDPMCQT